MQSGRTVHRKRSVSKLVFDSTALVTAYHGETTPTSSQVSGYSVVLSITKHSGNTLTTSLYTAVLMLKVNKCTLCFTLRSS